MPSPLSAAARAQPRLEPSRPLNALFAPVDISSLVFFRIFFGAMMLWTLWDFYAHDLIATLYVNPPFHFTYHGFSWVQRWPGQGMYVHFAVLAVLAAFVMAGFLYRLSALLLFLGFTYVFLLEKAVYLNHYYLMCLVCLLLIFLPAHRSWSVDCLLRPRLRSDVVPAWTLWLLRFQIGLPYVYGGLAKVKGDWLQGQPMQMWLSISAWRYVLGPVAEEDWLALVLSWGGLVFDLTIVPLLLWRRTRALAFGAVIVFHLLNAFMFDIGVFPWLMIGATTVFFSPDWPRHVITPPRGQDAGGRRQDAGIRKQESGIRSNTQALPTAVTRKHVFVVVLLLFYVAFHLIIPFHRWLYPGNVLWTEQGTSLLLAHDAAGQGQPRAIRGDGPSEWTGVGRECLRLADRTAG